MFRTENAEHRCKSVQVSAVSYRPNFAIAEKARDRHHPQRFSEQLGIKVFLFIQRLPAPQTSKHQRPDRLGFIRQSILVLPE